MKNYTFSIRLKAARQMLGLSLEQLSERMSHQVSKQSIMKYEQGKMKPKAKTMKILTTALNISQEYLFGNGRSINTPMLRNAFNNSLPPENIEEIEAQLAFWSEQYIEAEKKAGMELSFINPLKDIYVSDLSDVSEAADFLRRAWNCGSGPIPSILRLMERKGIKILDMRLPNDVLGLSTWADEKYPLVILDTANERQTVECLRFTAAHELAHLVLNIPQKIVGKEREKLCNKFAGCFLLPHSTLTEEIGSDTRQTVTLEELIDLHEVYGVSIAALVHELWDFRIISREHYDWWYDERIKKNKSEKGWGTYVFPETIGREKRINSNNNLKTNDI